jgi:hypothetical protein
MALYLGSDKIKINLDGVVYCLNLLSVAPTLSGIMLLSFDDYILTDSNGVYLTAKEEN